MRHSVLGSLAFSAAAAMVAALGVPTPAHASPYYPKCGPVGTAGNEVCIRFINNYTGVDMVYRKKVGDPVTVRFSYVSGSFGHYDDGWFTAVKGKEYTYSWNNASPGRCVAGTLHQSNGATYVTGELCR